MFMRCVVFTAVLAVALAPAQAELGDFLFRIDNPTPLFADNFGGNVRVIGDRIVVGSPTMFDDVISSGFAHIFDMQGNLIKEIVPPDLERSANFGYAVAGIGEQIFISAPFVSFGRVYEFDPDGELVQTIDNPSQVIAAKNRRFGKRLAVTQDSLVVSKYQNSVYFFDLETGEFQNEIRGGGDFGGRIDTVDGRVVIAATDLPAEDSGREPRVFTYTVPAGELELEIFSPTEDAGVKQVDGWGDSLGTGPGTFFVGSMGRDGLAGHADGRVDVYDVETGELTLQFTDPWPLIPHGGGYFGWAIEDFGQDILVSDTSDFSTADYVGLFDGTTGDLRHQFERPGDPNAETQFGWSIAATDELILISDPQAEVNGVPGAGTIFVYQGLPEPDPFYGDANLDGIVDAADLNILGNNWLHENVSGWSDFNGDHRVDQIDLNVLGEHWLAVKSPTATAVPEPSSMVLFSIFLVASFCRYGRVAHPGCQPERR